MMMSEEQVTDKGTQTDTEMPDGEEEKKQPVGEEEAKQSAEGDKKQTDSEKEQPDEKPEVPESYEFPEDLEMNDEQKEKYTELFKKHGASQEAVDEFTKEFKEQVQKLREASVQAWYDQVKKWGEEAEKDKEIGGSNFQKNIDSVIVPLVNKFGDQQLIDELDQTGFGNNPRLLKMFYRIGKELGIEAGFVEGKPSGVSDSKSIAEIMYPTMFNKDKQ